MADDIHLITSIGPSTSPARTRRPRRKPFRVGAVQQRWHPDASVHAEALANGIRRAAAAGAELICLQELTLSRYFAIDPDGPQAAGAEPEQLPGGPTFAFAAGMAAETGAHVLASLYERADGDDGLGFNTAIVVAPDGALVARTRKLHIPITEGYHEDRYFRPGPADDDAFALVALADARVGLPTCWDQWFPELARAYSLEGADVLVYPTAIGSEPDHPQFDTEPLWERVIVGNAIANGLFMVAVNRIGEERPAGGGAALTFYGSSFICDPRGDKVSELGQTEEGIASFTFDLARIRRTRGAWGFFRDRRPELYGALVDPDASRSGK